MLFLLLFSHAEYVTRTGLGLMMGGLQLDSRRSIGPHETTTDGPSRVIFDHQETFEMDDEDAEAVEGIPLRSLPLATLSEG
jgi:hypothetical protein